MAGNPETLTNAAGVVVFEGTTSESGGAPPLTKTLAAAAVSARWDSDAGYAAVEWPEYDADTFTLLVPELANTLDGDLTYIGLYAYDSGATTADVLNNGENLSTTAATVVNTYSVAYAGANVIASTSVIIAALLVGKAAYIVYQGGTTPPTTGETTIRALRLT